MHPRILIILLAFVLAACAGAPATNDIPVFTGATPIEANTAPAIAQALVGGFTGAIGAENARAITLYNVPDATTWSEVKAFYAAKLGDWQAVPSYLVENDTFSYAAWQQGGRTLVIGLVENTLGEGAYLTTAVVAR